MRFFRHGRKILAAFLLLFLVCNLVGCPKPLGMKMQHESKGNMSLFWRAEDSLNALECDFAPQVRMVYYLDEQYGVLEKDGSYCQVVWCQNTGDGEAMYALLEVTDADYFYSIATNTAKTGFALMTWSQTYYYNEWNDDLTELTIDEKGIYCNDICDETTAVTIKKVHIPPEERISLDILHPVPESYHAYREGGAGTIYRCDAFGIWFDGETLTGEWQVRADQAAVAIRAEFSDEVPCIWLYDTKGTRDDTSDDQLLLVAGGDVKDDHTWEINWFRQNKMYYDGSVQRMTFIKAEKI